MRERAGTDAGPATTWHFEQQVIVNAPAADVWARVVTPEGINHEMRPVMTMTLPRKARGITIDSIRVGQPVGRALLRLGGLIPFDTTTSSWSSSSPGAGSASSPPC